MTMMPFRMWSYRSSSCGRAEHELCTHHRHARWWRRDRSPPPPPFHGLNVRGGKPPSHAVVPTAQQRSGLRQSRAGRQADTGRRRSPRPRQVASPPPPSAMSNAGETDPPHRIHGAVQTSGRRSIAARPFSAGSVQSGSCVCSGRPSTRRVNARRRRTSPLSN